MNPNNASYPQPMQPGMPPGYDQTQSMPGQQPLDPNLQIPNQQPQAVAPKASNPNSTQNTLQIAEIRDGIVIMNDGSFRSVVMLRSVNFDLMNPQEQEAVEAGYQSFLNSLYFPIQILVRSKKVDIGPYIQKLDKIRSEHDNMLLSMLMEDYIIFMSNIAMQTNIMDKQFFIVIPFMPAGLEAQKAVEASKNFLNNLIGSFRPEEQLHVVIDEAGLEEAKTELRNRVQAVLSGLMQTGVQGLPLDTQELIELYYDSYNPDTATRQQLKNFNDLTAPVVTKGEGFARQPNLEKELQ
ncbi:hypothetical protein KC867_01740 [Candidatus Saccharibacteria bacterium]|nr:hypothetical protein [Candidatus Saccharibacteria bacterium]